MADDTDGGSRTLTTTCCIAGGGPAGMIAGYLLARAGIDVIVLEKHADFLRDFRGDTIHPSTLELMYELGVLDRFLQRPHQKTFKLRGRIGDEDLVVADFTHLPTRCGYIAFMPQWDFLDFLAEEGAAFDTFHLRRQTEVTGLVLDKGRVVGVRAKDTDGPLEIRAELVIGADGRHSTVREEAGLPVRDLGAPMDVLWMRIPNTADDPDESLGRFDAGRILALINRRDYWQVAYVIEKGGFDAIREKGIAALRTDIATLAPFLADSVDALKDWDDVSLLTVTVDRLETWHRPGLLCIGDAAHAMSPVGGVGINLAIQDAVAAANLLHAPLRAGHVAPRDLDRVQRRRMWPTRVTQAAQVAIQNRIISNVLAMDGPMPLPWPLKLVKRFPALARIPARLVGMGARPEHIHSPKLV